MDWNELVPELVHYFELYDFFFFASRRRHTSFSRGLEFRRVLFRSVVVLGVPDAQQAEHLQRALAWRHPLPDPGGRQRRLDREAHLPRVPALALCDRVLDPDE